MRRVFVVPVLVLFFFFQAEDGIRDLTVTGVQTCALPISPRRARWAQARAPPHLVRHARAGARARAPLQEERHSRRRRARQVSPARRCGGVRLAGADGPGFFAALSAGGWPGELRALCRRSTRRLP